MVYKTKGNFTVVYKTQRNFTVVYKTKRNSATVSETQRNHSVEVIVHLTSKLSKYIPLKVSGFLICIFSTLSGSIIFSKQWKITNETITKTKLPQNRTKHP